MIRLTIVPNAMDIIMMTTGATQNHGSSAHNANFGNTKLAQACVSDELYDYICEDCAD